MPDRRPSLNRIAQTAGVSVSTVSRYVRGQLTLRPETEARILGAADRLGYRGLLTPGGLRGDSRPATESVIGVVVPELANPYFGIACDEIVRAAKTHGRSVVVASTLNHSAHQLDGIDMLDKLGVAGLVYIGNYVVNASLERYVERGNPVVIFDEHIEHLDRVDRVGVDDYSGAFQATALLASLGHERIAFLSGPVELRSVQERERGWRDALRAASLDPDAQMRMTGTFSIEFGAGAVPHLLSAAPRPTAVFAASDVIALGVMRAARSSSIEVPGDLSVIGFDDVPQASLVTPRLSSVRTPLDAMATTAVSLLLGRMAAPDGPPVHTVLPVILERRESVGAPAPSAVAAV